MWCSAQSLIEAFLKKLSICAFTYLESRYGCWRHEKYAKSSLNHRVIGPFLAWFKGPYWVHFCIVHNKKAYSIKNLNQPLAVLTLTTWPCNICKKSFEKIPVICKIKKHRPPIFTFILRTLNLPTKIHLTAVAPRKHIRATRKQCRIHNQNHNKKTFIRWRKKPMVIKPTLVKDPTSPLLHCLLKEMLSQHRTRH